MKNNIYITMKELIAAILVITITVVSLASCSLKKEEIETETDSGTQDAVVDEKNTADKPIEESATVIDEKAKLGSLSDNVYASYADALKANEAELRADGRDWQRDINGKEFQNNVLLAYDR